MAVALALLSSLLWGAADFLGGTLTRRHPLLRVLAVSQSVALLALLPVVALTAGRDAGRPVVVGLVAGVVGAVALAAFYRALATGTMGVVAPISSLGAVVPFTVGLLRGEAPRAAQLAGAALALGGVVVASRPELPLVKGSGRPVRLALVAAAGFGTVQALVARGSSGHANVAVLLASMRVASLALFAVPLLASSRAGRTASRSHNEARRPPAAILLPAVSLGAVGLLDVAANGSFAFATRAGLVSVVAVLSSLYPVATLLLARWLHRERLSGGQLAGVGTALAGVVLIAGA